MAINGIERIAERILRDAQTEADGIRSIAEDNCAKIGAEYEKQATDAAGEILGAAEKEAADLIKRMKGESEMKARTALLEEKQALMDKAFDLALQEILAMDEAQYRAFLVRLACKACVTGKEELVLNEKDQKRFGKALCDEINAKLAEEGKTASITLGKVPADIEGGLKLRAGAIETNCSIRTLIEAGKDRLTPEVAAMLFG